MDEQKIHNIVKKVMEEMALLTPAEETKHPSGIFDNMHLAIEASIEAQKIIHRMSMDGREKIIEKIRLKTMEHAEYMAKLGVEETGMGNVGDKILKHRLVASRTPGTEDIQTYAYSGDRGLTLTEMGAFGVIGAITPSTNPSETILNNSISMIAGGNTVVFNPHPAAVRVSNYAVGLVNEASIEAGGPPNVAVSVANPTMESSSVMMKHPAIALIAATGGPGVVDAVLSSGKRGIGAGAGNPPVLVDNTADLKKAAQDIINGCTFDNNLPCIAEKEIIVFDSVADELIHYLLENDCYRIDGNDLIRLQAAVLSEKGLNRNCVGRDAVTLLGMIGIEAKSSIRCIIFEGDKEHPLITEELMMPILGIVRASDIDDAIEKAVWLEHGNRHSAHMHSKNIDNLTRFGKAVDTAIFVKNAPSYAAFGFGGEGFCTFTIASRTGEGLTSARTFTKQRRCVMSDSLCVR